jgi:hypothetical protein
MEGAVQLLANIIALLTPLPYFRPILMTVADKVLDAGEMYSNSVSPSHWRTYQIANYNLISHS